MGRMQWRCEACGEVIGVYEPCVVIDAAGERATSRLAERVAGERDGCAYHTACHEQAGGSVASAGELG